MEKYIIINMGRITKNKLVYWKQSCYGYTEDLGKAGLFYNLKGLNLESDDISLKVTEEENEIGLTISDIKLAQIVKNGVDTTIDLDQTYLGVENNKYKNLSIIEILRKMKG